MSNSLSSSDNLVSRNEDVYRESSKRRHSIGASNEILPRCNSAQSEKNWDGGKRIGNLWILVSGLAREKSVNVSR